MQAATSWVLGAAVLAGLGLAGLWLQERRPAWWLGAVHGVVGLLGSVMVVLVLARASDGQGFGRLAAWFVGIALAGGGVVTVMQVLRRRPPGLVVALHATMGVAGFVLWLAFGAAGR